MSLFKSLKQHLKRPLFGVILASLIAIFAVSFTPVMSQPAFADTTDAAAADETCYDQVGAIGWLICPTTGVLGKAIDAVYGIIEELLTVQPLATNDSSPIFQVWQIMRDITNIVFVIVLLIVIYSQITGIGINNYGIKKALPKLIIAAVLVNLSFIICAVAVDVSNIVGANLRGVFENIEINAINNGGLGDAAHVTWTQLAGALIGGGAVAGISIGVAGGLGAFLWPVLAALIGGILSVIVGLVTISLRQALVAMLIMISPLAFVAYLLPNTEQYFKKWKDLLISMLIFYPMFSLLFGAAQLAGWAIIASSGNAGNLGPFFVVLGMAVQVFPLFLSVSLLKMSNTILGSVSSKLDNLFNKPRAGARAMADQQRQLSAQRHINHSVLPSAGLRRYLDARNRRRELDLENETTVRKGRAEIAARRKIAGNVAYRPGEETQDLRANASTRSAKEASNIALELDYVSKDTEHVLGHYDQYHNRTKRDQRLNAAAGSNFMQSYRATLAAENDAYADQDWLMGEYNKIRALGETNHKYKSQIIGAAGALGREGEHTVLGQVIAQSAANESKRKSYTNLVYSKYGYGKSDARSMIVGYYVDDDGFATTKPDNQGRREKLKSYTNKETGETIAINERSPGEFYKYHPEYLEQSAYDKYEVIKNPTTGKEERHYYYDARDQQGKFIGRIYKNDTAAMKELLSNWDMPIADPINGLYGILAGVYEDPNRPYGLQGVGLAQLSTTLNRATMSSGFKEKASFAGPMYATSVGQRYITDFVQLNIARLDNLIKTAKPSGFNTQDVAEFNQLQMLMNPTNWEWMLFDEQSLRNYRNVNGQHLKGTRFAVDANGNLLRDEAGKVQIADKNIPIEKATFEELKNTILTKFLLPAAPKFATMMSRVTNGIIDNQKPGVAENWNKLLDSMDLWNNEEWKEKYPVLDDPFAEQTNDTISRARDVSHKIRPQKHNTSINPNQPSPFMRKLLHDTQVRANSGMGDPQEIQTTNQQTSSASGSTQQNVNSPAKQNPSPAASSTSDDKLYQLTDEDRAVDREFMQEEENAEWSIWSHSPETSRNYRVRIDVLASEYAYDTYGFIEAVRDYLYETSEKDPRLDSVIEKFDDFTIMNGGDDSLTTEDYAAALNGYIATDTFEE